jgi:hypothetical protein
LRHLAAEKKLPDEKKILVRISPGANPTTSDFTATTPAL